MFKKVALVSNGDFRDSADVVCWPMQEQTLNQVTAAFKKLGIQTLLANEFDKKRKHGFISTQAEGCRVFSGIPVEMPVVVVLSCWAYSHHVASALKMHKGPVLILGNFEGTWPGLVALLNHSATLARMDINHSRIWSTDFAGDPNFMKNLTTWANTGKISYSTRHLTDAAKLKIPQAAARFSRAIADDIKKNKRLIGQMDPGCMGMLNAVLSPEKTAAIGMPLELLNQSDLLAEMKLVKDREAREALAWLKKKGVNFHYGKNPKRELVETQVLEQMKTYIAAGRIYERYGLSAIGIPYQYGLVRSIPATDLVEGMLNNADRPPIRSLETGKLIAQGKVIPHFNEGDTGSGIPQTLMSEILLKKKMPAETTLHDVRWGDDWEGRFVWLFLISGGAPAAHFGGWKKAHVYRQPPMYFPLGGGTCSGVSKPGVITWARFYESYGKIGMDCGTGEVVKMPEKEVQRRWKLTTPVWPIANVHIPGYGRDELMATHQSNHITMCYGDILKDLWRFVWNWEFRRRWWGRQRRGFEYKISICSGT